MCGDSKRKQHRTFFPLNNKGHAAAGSANSAAGTLGDSQMRQWPTVTETSWRKVAAVKKETQIQMDFFYRVAQIDPVRVPLGCTNNDSMGAPALC